MATASKTAEADSPFRRLLGLDVFLAKAESGHPLAPFSAMERRLQKTLRAEFERVSESAIEAAQRKLEGAKEKKVTSATLAAASAAAGLVLSAMAGMTRERVSDVVRAAYVEDRKRILLRAAHLNPGSFEAPSLTSIDDAAVQTLSDHQAYWIGNSYSRALSDRIAEVSKIMVTQGVSSRVAGTKLGEILRAEFGLDSRIASGSEAMSSILGTSVEIPSGWTGTAAQYLDALAANTVTVGRTIGATHGLRESGSELLEIVAQLGPNCCEFCVWMDGKIFRVSDAVDLADQLVKTTNPEDVRRVQPWIHLGRFLKESGLGLGDKGPVSTEKTRTLVRYGKQLPPFHILCHCTAEIAADSRFRG